MSPQPYRKGRRRSRRGDGQRPGDPSAHRPRHRAAKAREAVGSRSVWPLALLSVAFAQGLLDSTWARAGAAAAGGPGSTPPREESTVVPSTLRGRSEPLDDSSACRARHPARFAIPVQAIRSPETGEFIVPEVPPAELKAALAPALSRPVAALVEVAGATPAEGIRLHLRGRFRTFLVGTKSREGTLALQCLPPPGEGGSRRPGSEMPPAGER